jgi:predicted phosphodiesterase
MMVRHGTGKYSGGPELSRRGFLKVSAAAVAALYSGDLKAEYPESLSQSVYRNFNAGDSPEDPSAQQELTIGFMTDTHVGHSNRGDKNLPFVVSQVSKQCDIIVDAGDCTAGGKKNQAKKYADILERSATVPRLAVPGNHDKIHTFEEYIGPSAWFYDIKGYRLIGINTNKIDWDLLCWALQSSGDRTLIFVGHHPLSYIPLEPSGQGELIKLLKAYKSKTGAYLGGHIHGYRQWTDPETGILFVTGSPARSGFYTFITMDGNDVKSEPKCSYLFGDWNGRVDGHGQGSMYLDVTEVSPDGNSFYGKIRIHGYGKTRCSGAFEGPSFKMECSNGLHLKGHMIPDPAVNIMEGLIEEPNIQFYLESIMPEEDTYF